MGKGFMVKGKEYVPVPLWPDGALYWEGEEFVSKIGGWEGIKASSCGTTCTFLKQADHLYAYAQGGNGSTLNPRESTVWWTTANGISLTSYSKVKITFEAVSRSSSGREIGIYIYSSKVSASTGWVNPTAKVEGINTDGTYEVNVSALSGLYYIAIMHYASYSGTQYFAGSKTKKVWLE